MNLLSYIWHSIVVFLVWLSSDPATLSQERPKCAAAVALARASMEVKPPPAPKKEEPAPCPTGKCPVPAKK